MKASKSAKVKEEECGVWLDTKELKDKKQQKSVFLQQRLIRAQPLNCNLARQSNILSFFPHKTRDPIRSTAHAGTTHTGAKRKHGVTIESETPQTLPQDRDGDGLSDTEKHFLQIICRDEPEEDEPPEKRRHVALYTDQNVLETREYRNKLGHPNQAVPFLHGASQEASPHPKNKNKPHPGGQGAVKASVLTSRAINENHRRASTESKTTASPVKRVGKENSSPIKNPSSPFKRHPISSPAKSRWMEKHTLPPGKHASAESAGETLASLFTQDSEGFCVIAHREKDRLSADKSCRKSPSAAGLVKEEEEEEEEMLFTQDSEGNMVIKH